MKSFFYKREGGDARIYIVSIVELVLQQGGVRWNDLGYIVELVLQQRGGRCKDLVSIVELVLQQGWGRCRDLGFIVGSTPGDLGFIVELV